MTDDKKNIPEAAPPTEAPAPAVENAVVPEQQISSFFSFLLERLNTALTLDTSSIIPNGFVI